MLLRSNRVRWHALALALVLLGGCSSDKSTAVPPRHTLSGRLRLEGRLFAQDGSPAGDRSVQDADSVRVYLLSDGALIDSTLTVDGRYAFSVALGNYMAFARVTPGIADSTTPLHLHDTDRVFPDTLRLAGTANLTIVPNPFADTPPFSVAPRIRYTIPATTNARMDVLRPSGLVTRVLFTWRSETAGAHEVIWDGNDDTGAAVATGPYWIVLASDGISQAEPVFKDP